MTVVSAPADLAPAIEPPRVTVVTLVPTPHADRAVEALRREAIAVAVATLAVLEGPAPAPVCVLALPASACGVIAPRVVAWAAQGALRTGLIGLVEDGGAAESEALLAEGFDDVVHAPVSGRELVARVRAVHRRVFWKGIANGRLRFADLTLDLYGRELWLDGVAVPLTSVELAVLRELMKARGRPLSRVELLERAWGDLQLEVSERAVDNVILRLRRKLPRPELIETVRSVGFRLAPRGA